MPEPRVARSPVLGLLRSDPSVDPAIADTGTWDCAAAWNSIAAAMVGGVEVGRIERIVQDGRVGQAGCLTIFPQSAVSHRADRFVLAALPDRQRVFLRLGHERDEVLGVPPLGSMAQRDGRLLSAYPCDADVIARYCRVLRPANAPQALGAVPRLGIGVRMTTLVWPGVFAAMDGHGFAANAIQNSVRELNLLDDLRAGRAPVRNYACGFGTIDSGYTGSTFEGLWVEGVLAALAHDRPLRYGADADHIQPKRADPDLVWPKRVIDAARHYTFFTLDVSDVLDYAALADGPTPAALARKYDRALDITAQLAAHIAAVGPGRPFDLELSIDEHPPEVPAFDCLTSATELAWVLDRLRERRIPVTHIAPNLGIEKGVEYRHPSGLAGLEERTRAQHRIAEAAGVMIDIHSADDLGPETRAAIHRATGGRVHYKISPSLQLLFAETLRDHDHGLFMRWWDDAFAYARREAEAGSPFARRCLATPGDGEPSPSHPVFHHFSFAFIGRRENDAFPHRAGFYRLPAAFRRDYADRVARRLGRLASDLF